MACINCASASYQERLHSSSGLSLLSCSACGLVYLSVWEQEFNAALYAYYDSHVGKPRGELYSEVNTARHREVLDGLGKLAPGRRLLDVGCGSGHFVHTARAAGWDAEGIDLADGAIRVCREFGLPCEKRDFFDASFAKSTFDVIVMSELLEHVPQPGRFFAKAHDLLAPGGVLYLTTPNFDSLSRRVLGAEWSVIHREHLAYFSLPTIREVANKAARWRSAQFSTRNLSPAALLHFARKHSPVPKRDGGQDTPPDSLVDQRARFHMHRLGLLPVLRTSLAPLAALTRLGETIVGHLIR